MLQCYSQDCTCKKVERIYNYITIKPRCPTACDLNYIPFCSLPPSGQARAPQAICELQGELGSGGDYVESNSRTARRGISRKGVVDHQRDEGTWLLCDTLTAKTPIFRTPFIKNTRVN